MNLRRFPSRLLAAAVAGVMAAACASEASADVSPPEAKRHISRIGVERGIVVLDGPLELAIQLAKQSELLVYLQLPSESATADARRQADAAGLLGKRIFIDQGPWSRLQLAGNLADAVLVTTPEGKKAAEQHRQELLRVVRPLGRLIVGEKQTTKPYPKDADDWSHPYHGPDNNPQSRDKLARYPYLTQFLAEPWYCPMPEVTVVSGGRVFKAFGHIAFKKREWPWLNTMVALNGYNGTMLWKRKLTPGFIIHRNTMVATSDTLYLADNDSCKLIDAASGEVRREIMAPRGASGPAFKWMALQDGVLYAMVGAKEKLVPVQKGTRDRGGWPWGPWKGFDITDYKTGLGHTLFAYDVNSQRVLWTRDEKEPLDGRAICLRDGRIYFYSSGKHLACVEAKSGEVKWRNSNKELLAAIGAHEKAQNPRQGFFTSAFMKCNDQALFFAGPQRSRLVAASTTDGRLLWQYNKTGNFQLVIRDDGLYAMGRTETSKKFDLLSGRVLEDLTCFRRACTRATGSVDTIFTRGHPGGGTLQFKVDPSQPRRIALMRPACHDGVVVAGGQLYWGPWMCDCNLQLVGFIGLGPAGDHDFEAEAKDSQRLQSSKDAASVKPFPIAAGDWPAYRANNQRTGASGAAVAKDAAVAWKSGPTSSKPTAPITAGGLTFIGGQDGVIRALDAGAGTLRWLAYTGGAVKYPPAVADGRLFAGSGDGWVYAFEAATGRRLWRFRAAPAERKINLHGRLVSTWPVGGGVLVENGVVYAAAGIASYDGTYVYALDAKTGRIRWQNNTSGHLAGEDRISGVSVQGHLLLNEGRLYMAGGNVVSPAVYDMKNGKCLNTLENEWLTARRGRELFLVNGKVEVFDKLLYGDRDYLKRPNFQQHFVQAQSGDVLIRGVGGRLVRVASGQAAPPEAPLKAKWQSTALGHVSALALGTGAVIAAGSQPASSAEGGKASYAVAALAVEDGKVLWRHSLPAMPVPWGLALDAQGRAIVALEDGRVMGFAGKSGG